MLSDIHHHPRDDGILFIPCDHTYFLKYLNKKATRSVTQLIYNFAPKFNANVVLKKMRHSDRFPTGPYANMSDVQIKNLWAEKGETSRVMGTKLHKYIEDYYNNNNVHTPLQTPFMTPVKAAMPSQQSPNLMSLASALPTASAGPLTADALAPLNRPMNPTTFSHVTSLTDASVPSFACSDQGDDQKDTLIADLKEKITRLEQENKALKYRVEDSEEIRQFYRFDQERKRRGWTPYRTEWCIYDEDLLLAGQLDMLFKHPDGTYVLVDWKRATLKYTNEYERCSGVLAHLDNCNFNLYSLQLYVYKAILEKRYGLPVSEMYMCVLHPDNADYQLVAPAELAQEASLLLGANPNPL